MQTTASRSASHSGEGGGASRTFQSLFGEGCRDDHAQLEPNDAPRIVAADRVKEHEDEEEDDADVWDDDFPSDANMESAEEDTDGEANTETKGQALSTENRQSMSEWAENDDDEDHWKDALQARVDQLELVVEKKTEWSSLHNATAQNDPLVRPQVALTAATYAPPVDQRATLTLVPKTNLLRSISAPPADEPKIASKLKTPQAVRSPPSNTGSSAGGKAKTSTGGIKQPGGGGVVSATGDQARKRSNSRDSHMRMALTKDQKHLTRSAQTAATTASNSVFVRAVVARGSSPIGGGGTGRVVSSETRIAKDGHAHAHAHAHVDKRAKADDRPAILALDDAEAVRRYILSDVKSMSVERIVADAKRLQFLEELHRRHPDVNEAKRSASASGGGVLTPSPTKKRAV